MDIKIIHPSIMQEVESQISQGISRFQQELWMLQILQSSVGCANSCDMCSQWASAGITRVTRDSLALILSALKKSRWIDSSQFGPLIWQERTHKPWIIFPYLDTDVGSDPNLDLIVGTLGKDFGCKTRISTVWFSRHNKWLQKMHNIIVRELRGYIEGFRISITPYTENFYLEDYPYDLANLLNTYLPVIESQWVGRDVFACELRFPPFVQNEDVDMWLFWGRFFIRSGDYFFITDSQHDYIPDNNIDRVEKRTVHLKEPMIPGKMYIFDGLSGLSVAEILKHPANMEWDICKVKNIDWDIFAVNPIFTQEWYFQAVHFLPKTTTRKKSGIIDSRRPFLNAMLDYKSWKNVSWKTKLTNGDIDDFLIFLQRYIDLHAWTQLWKSFWNKEILSVIFVTARAIKLSHLDDDKFFDPKFLVDTGHIVNQGRAKHLFQWLVSKTDEPITVNEMKWYGMENSIGSERGIVYRLAPIPLDSSWIRNIVRAHSGLILSWLHHKWLQPIPEKTYLIPANIDTTFSTKREVISQFGIPWLPQNI